MGEIAVSLSVLLIKGVPEGLLTTLALHIFTKTKIELKKYLSLSAIYIASTYIVRFLPIRMGVNTVLSLIILILCFQFTYKHQLSKIISSVISSLIIMILIALSEVLNVWLLTIMYGKEKAEELFMSNVGITKSISSIPSTVFLAIFILIGYFIISYIKRGKKKNGKTGEEISK